MEQRRAVSIQSPESASGYEEPFARLQDTTGALAALPMQDAVLPLVAAPVTPVTPVPAASFIAIQDTIMKKDACALDDVDRQNLGKHVENLAKAAQISLAKSALQEEHILFLLKMNDGGNPRRSARAIVLGTARVMSYEDLAGARAKRAEQEEKSRVRKRGLAEARARRAEQEKQGKAVKKKRTCGRKREGGVSMGRKSSTTPEARHTDDERNATTQVTQVAEPGRVDEPIAQCPGRAPTARMW